MKVLLSILLIVAAALRAGAQAPMPTNAPAIGLTNAASATFVWQPVLGAAGYKLYYGTNSALAPMRVTPLITNLAAVRVFAERYPIYARVTSVDVWGAESEFSDLAALLGPQTHVTFYGQTATNAAGPFGGEFQVLVISNAQGQLFTRLRTEARTTWRTLP